MRKDKKIGRKEISIRNIAAGFIYRVAGSLFPFLIRTIMIDTLGEEYLGLNSLFVSILNVLNLTEFGFANAITYKMYRPAAENDTKRLSELLSIYKRIYRIIGIIILVAGSLLIPFLTRFVNETYPESINLYAVYLLFLFDSAISYLLFAYRNSLFSAYQRLDIQSVINSVTLILLKILQALVLLCFKNYYVYIVLMPVFTVLNNVIVYVATRKCFPGVVSNQNINKAEYGSILKKSGAMFGHKLNYVIVSAADNIVISAFLGLTVLARYGNYFTILNVVIGLVDTVVQSFLPSVGNMLVEGNREKIKCIFRIMSFAQYWFVGWCAICLTCLYQPFMTLWVGKEMLLDMWVVILLALYLYFYKARSVVLMFKDAAGMWNEDLLKPYLSALCNIILNFALVVTIGLYGVLISTITVFLLINFPWESSILVKKLLKQSFRKYVCNFFYCMFVITFVGIVTNGVCALLFLADGVAELLVKGLLCIIIPNILFIGIFWRKKEMKELLEIMCSVWRRKYHGRYN